MYLYQRRNGRSKTQGAGFPLLIVALGVFFFPVVENSARAEEYTISAGTLPPTRALDSVSYSSRLSNGEHGVPDQQAMPSTTGTVVNPVPFASSGDSNVVRPSPFEPSLLPKCQVEIEPTLDPDSQPSASFLARVKRVYSMNDEAEQQAVWSWFLAEPSALTEEERIGNAVIRHILATGRSRNEAKIEALNPTATRGSIRSSNGLTTAASPWGRRGTILVAGTQLKLIPPADGVWYRIDSSSGSGWICGLWLDLQ